MSGCMSLEEKFETLMKNYEYLEKQNEYLRKQLGESLKNKRRVLHWKSHNSSKQSYEEKDDSQGNPFVSSSDSDSKLEQRRCKRHQHKQSNFDIKIEIP